MCVDGRFSKIRSHIIHPYLIRFAKWNVHIHIRTNIGDIRMYISVCRALCTYGVDLQLCKSFLPLE